MTRQEAATEADKRWFRWSALLPALVAIAAYLWVLDGWFLYDDFTQGYLLRHDAPGIDGNWGPILRDFGRAQFGIEGWVYYRPMMSVYLTACLELLGVDPVRLHAVNLCQHAVLTFLVATLCALYCRRRPNLAAVCGGTWFALHPVTVEAVAWFSANTVTFELLPRLGSMVAFAIYLRKRGKLALILSMLLAVLALVTKESAINLPAALVALHLLSLPRPSLRQLVVGQLPFVPIWAGYFVLRRLALGTFVAGAHAAAGSFLAALPESGPVQARAVFLPFGGPLPDGVALAAAALLLVFALDRGVSSRGGLLVLGAGAVWIATQFAPTALNHVYANLGGSRAHYGTLASAALWIVMLVFGRDRAEGGRASAWIGAALFAVTAIAFLPVRAERRRSFEEAWATNAGIQAELVRYGEAATPRTPVAVLRTPYDHDGVPQLNRTAHFTLCEVPFTPRDLPVLGLTSVFVPGAFGDAMLGDVSPLRAVRELGGTLLLWDDGAATFRAFTGRPAAALPAVRPAGGLRFELAAPVSPYDVEEVVLSVDGAPTGGRVRWSGGGEAVFGAGVRAGRRRVFRIDLTHDYAYLARDLAGGITSFTFDLEPVDRSISGARLELRRRLPELRLARLFDGATLRLGDLEHRLVAPALPDPELRLRLVLLAPNEPITFPVAAGRSVRLPRALPITGGMAQSLGGELKRILRLSRQRRFYYYFEASSPAGRALGGARSRVDFFRLEPGGPR